MPVPFRRFRCGLDPRLDSSPQSASNDGGKFLFIFLCHFLNSLINCISPEIRLSCGNRHTKWIAPTPDGCVSLRSISRHTFDTSRFNLFGFHSLECGRYGRKRIRRVMAEIKSALVETVANVCNCQILRSSFTQYRDNRIFKATLPDIQALGSFAEYFHECSPLILGQHVYGGEKELPKLRSHYLKPLCFFANRGHLPQGVVENCFIISVVHIQAGV